MKMQHFKINGSGLSRFFGPLEAQIMDVLWGAEQELTVKDVLSRLDPSKALSFNTVMTVMNRLVEKGVLAKRGVSRSFLYMPVLSREQFLDAQSKELTFDLIEEFGSMAVTHMVDAIDKADPALLEQLEQKIKELKRDK